MLVKKIKLLFLTVFFFLLLLVGILSLNETIRVGALKNLPHPMDKKIISIEQALNTNTYRHSSWVDYYGLFLRVIGKNEVDDFKVIKDMQGHLHQLSSDDTSPELIKEQAFSIERIFERCQETNSAFLYYQAPTEFVESKTTISAGLNENTNQVLDDLLNEISQLEVPNIDSRKYLQDLSLDEIFYKTDHHWNMKACFESYVVISEYFSVINRKNKFSDTLNLDNYETLLFADTFLGSRGIKIGSKYAGKDDFYVYIPKYETSFTYKHLAKGIITKETEGNFSKAFLDFSILESNYNNKYNSFLNGGTTENIIINKLITDGSKLLIIGDSFARPLTMYMSQNYSETRYVDPQKGRFDEDILDYISEYMPSNVVIVINGLNPLIPFF